jgi:hypothetical protein
MSSREEPDVTQVMQSGLQVLLDIQMIKGIAG